MPKHRAPRRRKRDGARTLGATAYRDPFAAGVALAANPNRAKRNAAPATSREHDLTVSEAAGASGRRHEYAPLTVHTPIARARKAPRTTSYTI